MKDVKNKNNFGRFFIVFLTSFLLGFIVSFSIAKNLNNELLKTVYNSENNINKISHDLDLEKFWEVYNLIKLNSYDSESIDKDKLVDSAIKGMVDGLGDKHTEFFDKKETKKFNEVLSGDFEGIGAVVQKNPLGVTIDRIIKGSPAKKYGLKTGDIIIKANGNILEGLGVYDSVELIKGKAGTQVKLEVIREGEKNILEFDVIRDKIKIPSVDWEEIDNSNLGYISINMFGEDTSDEFNKALKEYKDKDGIVIDLRDNGGGYLQSSVFILSNFIEENKTLLNTKYKNIFSNTSYPSLNEGELYNGKIVVLINENSASASEILALALRDYKKAIIIGNKSYGKGSVQKPFNLNDGSMLKLTVAKWFSPEGINIDGEGIIPDINVEFKKEDYTPVEGKEKDFEPYDRQREEAVNLLKEFLNFGSYKLTIDKFLDKNPDYNPENKK